MSKKVDEFVKQNVEELAKYSNYLVKATKIVFDVKRKRYNVGVSLQLFVDEEGNLKIIREV